MRVKVNQLVEGTCELGAYALQPGVFYELPDLIIAAVLEASPGHTQQFGEPLGEILPVEFVLPEPPAKPLTKKEQAALDAVTPVEPAPVP